MEKISQIADEMNSHYRNLSTQKWVQYTTGFDLGVQGAQLKVNEFKKNPQKFKLICDVLEKSSDQLERRNAKILHGFFKPFHQSEKARKLLEESQALENSIMDKINKYRVQVDGKEISSPELNRILSQSDDRKLREKVYNGRLPLNKIVIDAGFLKLLEIRKELALASGYKSFVDLKLDEEELSSDLFDGWQEQCNQRKARYKEKEQALAQNFLNLESLAPWDHAYLKTQVCSYNQTEVDLTNFYEPIAKTFLKFGFDIRNLNLTYDIFPRKNKSEWGYNFTIEMGKDSRVLANVANRFSNYWVLLHETAHGVHFMGLNPQETAINYGISGIVAEGFANYFGNLSYSKEFLSEVLPADTVEKSFAEFKKLEKVMHFQNYRTIPDILFDHQLYLKDLESENDIQTLRQEFNSKILGEDDYAVPWARLIHHTGAPIYLHNYFLGDVMCENMKAVFSRNNPGKTAEQSPLEFGQFWKEKVLAPSGRLPFLELYDKVCEEKLSITRYLDSRCLA